MSILTFLLTRFRELLSILNKKLRYENESIINNFVEQFYNLSVNEIKNKALKYVKFILPVCLFVTILLGVVMQC